tara:strand:+ start:286 stop:588 length:303 start_codon:yes stop_codon:yes gene_type:complete
MSSKGLPMDVSKAVTIVFKQKNKKRNQHQKTENNAFVSPTMVQACPFHLLIGSRSGQRGATNNVPQPTGITTCTTTNNVPPPTETTTDTYHHRRSARTIA